MSCGCLHSIQHIKTLQKQHHSLPESKKQNLKKRIFPSWNCTNCTTSQNCDQGFLKNGLQIGVQHPRNLQVSYMTYRSYQCAMTIFFFYKPVWYQSRNLSIIVQRIVSRINFIYVLYVTLIFKPFYVGLHYECHKIAKITINRITYRINRSYKKSLLKTGCRKVYIYIYIWMVGQPCRAVGRGRLRPGYWLELAHRFVKKPLVLMKLPLSASCKDWRRTLHFFFLSLFILFHDQPVPLI